MLDAATQISIFTAEAIIIMLVILFLLITFFMLLGKAKEEKNKSKLVIKNLNQQYEETKETLLAETLPKKKFKLFLKTRKAEEKAKHKKEEPCKNIFVPRFMAI